MIFDDRNECAAVLDWEMTTIGPPEEDLGWWLFLDTFHSQGTAVPRLPGFPTHEETEARYARTARPAHWRTCISGRSSPGYRFAVVMMRITGLTEEMGLVAARRIRPATPRTTE